MQSFCPRCGTELDIQPEWVGQPAECPCCHARFFIQSADDPASQPNFQMPPESQPQQPGWHTYSPPPPPQGVYPPPPQGCPPPQGGYAPPPQGCPPPQGGYAPPPPWGVPQTFVPNNPKEPVSPASFSYQRVGNKFYVIGDYPTVFAVVNDFCSRSRLQVEKTDINLGCITIKYNFEFTHFVFFYQEADKMVVEVASNAIMKIKSAVDSQLRKLLDTIEAAFYQYGSGQYMPRICYDALLPQAYQRAEIDYTSEAKTLVWMGPLVTVLAPLGFLIALIFGIIYLVKICSTRTKKGQEFVYISFGLDIVGVIFNSIVWAAILG